MPLGKNRRYNTVNGLPTHPRSAGAIANLRPTPPADRGGIVAFGQPRLPVYIETRPKTGDGLPTGENEEQYIAHFSGVFAGVSVFALTGDAITVGEELNGVITAISSSYTGDAQVGDLINGTALTNTTVVAFDQGREPVVWGIGDTLNANGSIAANTRGEVQVLIGV